MNIEKTWVTHGHDPDHRDWYPTNPSVYYYNPTQTTKPKTKAIKDTNIRIMTKPEVPINFQKM